MTGSGVFEVEYEGEKFGFHFGTLSGYYTEEKAGKGIQIVLKEMARTPLISAVLYLYGGAKAYCELKGVEKNITIPLVSLWIDRIGPEKAAEIIHESLKGPTLKNGVASETGQKTRLEV